MTTHILGIRHHGVGSAQKVAQRLAEIQPDIILIEGPPEISEAFKVVGHKELNPPVAIMVYNSKIASESSFYPFSEFSPEWVAAAYANKNKLPIKAMDLPASINFKQKQAVKKAKETITTKENSEVETEEEATITPPIIPKDPISYIADIAGFSSGEEWWEYHFEQNKNTDAKEHFEAVQLVMQSLREEGIASSLDKENINREAYMRSIIKTVQNEMYENIAVICGAWHGPALVDIDNYEKTDSKILKSLGKSKIDIGCAWIPWTNSRLSMQSGYGAGISSPGWYEHCWETEEDLEIKWLSKVASAFREEGMDISTAHVLETYRLAYAIASLRNQSRITLAELNESIHTVMCMGDGILFELIKKKIVVGERLGHIPDDLTKVPLQKDFDSICKFLRLKFTAEEKTHVLDLRKSLDLKRSIFFHRLELLEINWGKRTESRSKGTFKETWVLKWDPNIQIAIIDKAYYGNSILSASNAFVAHKVKQTRLISDLILLLKQCIPAELFEATEILLQKINDESAISADTKDLMTAIPVLVDIIRYGDVRKSDVSQLEIIAERLFSKICITLPNACYGLDEKNSNAIFELIIQVNTAIKILEEEELSFNWANTLENILDKTGVHSVIMGCTVRLLLDNNQLAEDRAANLISYYLSNNHQAADVAFWVEGFLRGSGLILIYDDRIWNLLYQWVATLEKDKFLELLPILRRAFSKFQYGERRQIGQKAKKGIAKIQVTETKEAILFDQDRAAQILPFIQKFYG